MQTTRTTTVLIAIFVLALGAGLVAGTLASRLPASGSHPAANDHMTLGDDLQLTAGQRQQMRQIWEDVRTTANQCAEEAVTDQHDRDNAIYSLLTEPQKRQWDHATRTCSDKINALKLQREQAVKSAVQRTEQILTAPQREMYDKLIKDRLGRLSGPVSALPGLENLEPNDAG